MLPKMSIAGFTGLDYCVPHNMVTVKQQTRAAPLVQS
jgi:hypothetical protein